MNETLQGVCIGVVLGAVGMSAALYLVMPTAPTGDELRAQYYATEVATLVSPHSIRERMDTGDDSFLLVDVRTQEDYEREHIIGAINIDTSQPLADTLAAFATLPTDKQVIVYCYSTACMNGRKAGNFLAENGIYVQEMTVGWNEWRYDWEMWNYDTEWDDHKVEDYVVAGSEPGTPTIREESDGGCPIGGSLSC